MAVHRSRWFIRRTFDPNFPCPSFPKSSSESERERDVKFTVVAAVLSDEALLQHQNNECLRRPFHDRGSLALAGDPSWLKRSLPSTRQVQLRENLTDRRWVTSFTSPLRFRTVAVQHLIYTAYSVQSHPAASRSHLIQPILILWYRDGARDGTRGVPTR